ncbi:MAG TPA: NADH-quinone oxidoreductase subunit C [Terriglobales bacterium]|nr:NADH-quinone oxidoreductase subunit C [Terriglobales bacterium]
MAEPAVAITDLEQLKEGPALARLLDWNPGTVQGARFQYGELNVYIDCAHIRDACSLLKNDPELQFTFLSDITCVDWYPSEPRFEVVYHLLAMARKKRLRLKVKLAGDDPHLESVTSVWRGANFFEREIYDLFGVRFSGHPNLRRILMPEDWEGHPLRKDYPVEGYR